MSVATALGSSGFGSSDRSGSGIFACPLSAVTAVAGSVAASANHLGSLVPTGSGGGGVGGGNANLCEQQVTYPNTSTTRVFRHYHHYNPSSASFLDTTTRTIRAALDFKLDNSAAAAIISAPTRSTSSTSNTPLRRNTASFRQKPKMQRQRSASHCPTTGVCLLAKAPKTNSRSVGNGNHPTSSNNSSTRPVDSFENMTMVSSPTTNYSGSACSGSMLNAPPPPSPGTSIGGQPEMATPSVIEISAEEIAANNRACSLRVLNKRFNMGLYDPVAEAQSRRLAKHGAAGTSSSGNGKKGKRGSATKSGSNKNQRHDSLRATSSPKSPPSACTSPQIVSPSSSSSVAAGGASNGPNSSTKTSMFSSKKSKSSAMLNNMVNGHDGGGNAKIRRGGSGRRGLKGKQRQLRLNELNDRCLVAIFELLSVQERLSMERVCRRWQQLIRVSLQTPASLNIGEHSAKCNCHCSKYPSLDLPPSKQFQRDEAGYIIYPHSVLCYLMSICCNLRCINFSHCNLDDQSLQVTYRIKSETKQNRIP